MTLAIIRLASFGFVLCGAIIALGTSISVITAYATGYELPGDNGGYYPFEGGYDWSNPLSVGVSALTLMTLPVLMIFPPIVAVEFVWLTILWVFWLWTGAEAASPFAMGARCIPGSSLCHRFVANEAFAFINWITLMIYTIAIAICASVNGNQWRRPVKHLSKTNTAGPGFSEMDPERVAEKKETDGSHAV